MNSLKVIGLTGGLASGKTTVGQSFANFGAVVLDADKIARRALYKNSKYYKQIVVRFGRGIIDQNGTINRGKLAEIAFKNKKEQKALCDLTHPWVFDYVEKKIKTYKNDKDVKLLIIEAALLIESGLYKKMDKIVLVLADESQQLSRAKLTRNMDVKLAEKRMQYQMSSAKKNKYSDYVIDNRGAFENIEEQVKKIIEKILKD